jgi:ribosomal protein S18 acetylase RimI-like enzyme
MPGPVPAPAVPSDRLLELTHALRASLAERGEHLPAAWVEEAANDLRAGRLQGWAIPGTPGGLSVLSIHGPRAVGHVHIEPGAGPSQRGIDLLGALRTHVPRDADRTDAGVTGLDDAEERSVAAHFEGDAGFSVLRRFRLARSTAGATSDPGSPFPVGIQRILVRELPIEQLAQLDWAGFQGTPDEAFVAEDVSADQRLLADILDGRLGRFLDEASAALINADDQLVGAVLTAEDSPRSAVLLDLVVHPAFRRQGVASSLLRWGLRASAALGYATVTLWVTETNRPARALYEGAGFVPDLQTAIYRWSTPGPAPATHAQPGR